jgi:hypothetical protein
VAREARRRIEQTRGVEEGERQGGGRKKKGRLKTCEEVEGILKVWKRIGLGEGAREGELWVGCF